MKNLFEILLQGIPILYYIVILVWILDLIYLTYLNYLRMIE